MLLQNPMPMLDAVVLIADLLLYREISRLEEGCVPKGKAGEGLFSFLPAVADSHGGALGCLERKPRCAS
jgi:hypothetical protein